MYIVDQRSQEVLQQIITDIQLIEHLFLNNYIFLKYRFKDEIEAVELTINSPLEFAAFCFHQQLIALYDVDESGVHMYQRVYTCQQNRYMYPVNKPGYIEVPRITTAFTAEEIIKMIARREYDFGDRRYEYGAGKGLIRKMITTNNTSNAA